MAGWVAAIAVLGVACAGLGWWVAGQKGREPNEGLWLGLLFGPLGVLVEALLPGDGGRSAEAQDGEDEPGPDLRMFGPPKPAKRGWELPEVKPKPPDDPPADLDIRL